MYDDKAEQRDECAATFVKYMRVPVCLCDPDEREYKFAMDSWGEMYSPLYDAVQKAIKEGQRVRR